MSQAIYRKWRPRRFADVIGQEHVTQTLQSAVTADRVGHAYLFCGPRGTGKTTIARLLAKAVNCLDPAPEQRPCNRCAMCRAVNEGRLLDLIEIDAASNTGVDDIRDLRDKINFAPSEGRFKIYIIDEVHMLSTAAFNALLKTLEEPPPHAKFILATTEEHKVPATIKSRCQQFNFRLLGTAEIVGRLRWLAVQEQLTVEPAALELIAREGAGSLRDAESLLDQLATAPGAVITLGRVQQALGTAGAESVRELVEAWLTADATRGLRLIHDALSTGADARQFCRQIVGYLRQVLLVRSTGGRAALDLPADQEAALREQAQRAPRRALIAALRLFNEAALAPPNSWQPQLPLELAFLETLAEVGDAEAEPARPSVGEPTPRPTAEPRAPEPVRPVVATAAPTVVAAPPAESPQLERPATAAALPTTDAAPEPQLTLAQFAAQWPAMIGLVKQHNRNVPPVLANCRPLALEGDVLVLGFTYPILRDKFNAIPDAAALVADAFGRLLQTRCRIRTVLTQEYTPAAPLPVSRAELEAAAAELGGVVRDPR